MVLIATLMASSVALPAIVPWPQSLKALGGSTMLSRNPTISAATPALRPLAQELAREIQTLTGVSPAVLSGTKGQIVLRLDSTHKGESFLVDTRGQVMVAGGTYAAVAMGTAELIQCMEKRNASIAFPKLHIEDRPLFGYRGLMLDVARKPHSIPDLRRAVMLCHVYRVRYLQLHLTDDQGWTFPSTKYPALGSKNEKYQEAEASPRYSREDLEALVRYADLLGVTIIPEIDTPGHTAAMRRAQPDPFASVGGTKSDGILDVLEPANVLAVKEILNEADDLFRSSPYLHIGGDEAEIDQLKKQPTYAQRLKQGDYESPWDLFLEYINDLGASVHARGKTPIVWEFYRNHLGHNIRLPEGSIIMAWEDGSNGARQMLDHGYSVINVPWTVGYRSNPKDHFLSNPYNVNGTLTKPGEHMLGLQLNVWESTPDQEWPALRASLPARMETAWRYPVGTTFAEFQARFQVADRIFGKLAGLAPDR